MYVNITTPHPPPLSFRSQKPLLIGMTASGAVTLRTDDMDMAGDIIQALASYLNLDNLQVTPAIFWSPRSRRFTCDLRICLHCY